MTFHSLGSSILYQNAAKTITLLDIPRSIASAQGTEDHPCTDQLYSSPPLQIPYPSAEPKSEKAKAKVLRTKERNGVNDSFPITLLHQALRHIAEHWQGDWYVPRKISPISQKRQVKKRKFEDGASEACSSLSEDSRHRGLVDCCTEEPQLHTQAAETDTRRLKEALALSAFCEDNAYIHFRHITNRLVQNLHPTTVHLTCSETGYRIPPGASALMSKVDEYTTLAMSMAALTAYPYPSATVGPGQFNLVLLDPPWQNRSVRRSAKYDTARDTDPMVVLKGMLNQHIAPGTLVGCWVTNKGTVRDAALDAFQAWDVDLFEEWAWLKITASGDPVTELEGVWRKPYEVFLLGRKRDVEAQKPSVCTQRVIVGVPDFHSRKPNLKGLIEPFLPANEYRALEIFARNLTAGWFSWGNEVLKYNWEGHWLQGAKAT